MKIKPQENLPLKQKPRARREPFKRDPYEMIAQGMEEQFAGHLVKEMRKSIQKVKPSGSAEQYYESLLDQEYAKQMTTSPGLGIQEIVLDQIKPKSAPRHAPKNSTGYPIENKTIKRQNESLKKSPSTSATNSSSNLRNGHE